jgi:hypothetical protein
LIRIIRKLEVRAHPLGRHEKPPTHAALVFRGVETASERHEVFLATGIAPAKFDPGVTGSVGIPTHQKVPLHFLRGIRIRFQALRDNFAIEQKRELQC